MTGGHAIIDVWEEINDITQRMLTLTLRNLERNRIITRHYFPQIPPRVEYELTDIGRGALHARKDPTSGSATIWMSLRRTDALTIRRRCDPVFLVGIKAQTLPQASGACLRPQSAFSMTDLRPRHRHAWGI